MPDFDKPVGQDMKQEPPDELIGVHGHDLAFCCCRRSRATGTRPCRPSSLHEPVIADRDPVGVSAEILKNALGPIERRLAVDDPLLLVQIGDQGIECSRRRKMAYGAGVNEFVFGTELFQISDKLSPKELRHDLDRKEEVILARLPFPSVLDNPPPVTMLWTCG